MFLVLGTQWWWSYESISDSFYVFSSLFSVLSIRHTLLKPHRRIQRCIGFKSFKVLGSSGMVLIDMTGEKVSDGMQDEVNPYLACTICTSLGVIK